MVINYGESLWTESSPGQDENRSYCRSIGPEVILTTSSLMRPWIDPSIGIRWNKFKFFYTFICIIPWVPDPKLSWDGMGKDYFLRHGEPYLQLSMFKSQCCSSNGKRCRSIGQLARTVTLKQTPFNLWQMVKCVLIRNWMSILNDL